MAEVIQNEFDFIKTWLHKYAPEDVKFEIQPEMPALELSNDQKTFLQNLLEKLKGQDFVAENIHSAIYNEAGGVGLSGKDAFQLIYQLYIGKSSGPRVGYFLSSLGKDFVFERLRQAIKS